MQSTSGITDLSHMGLLKVSGAKAKDLLQGQLTCDLNEVSLTQSRLGAHCNPKGRIISLFRILLLEDDYYLQMPRNMITIALEALKKYAVFFKVELSDASDEWMKIGCVNFHLPQPPQHVDEVIHIDNYFIVKLPDECFEIFGKFTDMAPLWDDLSKKTDVLTTSHWDYSNLKNGTPMIYPETSGEFLPHEINLEQLNGISFKKGCYTGQEIIARMQYRGKLNYQLYLASCETNPIIRGTDIFDEQGVAGRVIDHVNSTMLITTREPKQKLYLDSVHTHPCTDLTEVNHVD